METTCSRRHHHHHHQVPSPRLVRSRSGSSAVSTVRSATSPNVHNQPSPSPSQRFTTHYRSTSTTKTRPHNNKEGHKSVNSSPLNNNAASAAYSFVPAPQNKTAKPSAADQLGSFAAKLLPRRPSAWALSPGRSMQAPPEKGSKKSSGGGGGGGRVGGVLRYFTQKKVSPVQEEEFHRFRILHNCLVQWRFANARAELAVSAANTRAQSKLLSVWIRIFVMRNAIVEKRIQMQRLKCEIKLYEILNPQILLLNEWAKLDKRNQESVAKLATILSGVSDRLPLIHGAKGDIISIYEAMSEAVVAMDGIEEIITRFFTQVERILYMVTELLITKKQHKENLEELEKSVTCVATLVEKETTLRTHCIQAALEYMRSQNY